MSVDWYPCHICGETFPDCGDYGYCGNCESMLCSPCRDAMVDKYGECTEERTIAGYGEGCSAECDKCTKSIAHDSDILAWALKKLNLTREEAAKQLMKEQAT